MGREFSIERVKLNKEQIKIFTFIIMNVRLPTHNNEYLRHYRRDPDFNFLEQTEHLNIKTKNLLNKFAK